MRAVKYIIIYFFIFVLISCEKTIPFEIKSDNLIVLNSLISPNDYVSVNLSQSIDITEMDTIKFLNNAIVNLYCENVFQEQLNFLGDGQYKSTLIPIPNKKYQIEVFKDGLHNAISETIIPPMPEILSITADSTYLQGFGPRVQITIDDKTETQDYYYLTIKGYKIESIIDYSIPPDTAIYGYDTLLSYHWIETENLTNLLFINNDQTLLGNEGSTSKETIQSILGTTETGLNVVNWLAFSDKFINGTKHTIELYIADIIRSSIDKPIYIELKAIHEDYYKYLKSLYYSENSGNTPFTEPTSIYNNISGGVGIFAGCNIRIDSVVTQSIVK